MIQRCKRVIPEGHSSLEDILMVPKELTLKYGNRGRHSDSQLMLEVIMALHSTLQLDNIVILSHS